MAGYGMQPEAPNEKQIQPPGHLFMVWAPPRMDFDCVSVTLKTSWILPTAYGLNDMQRGTALGPKWIRMVPSACGTNTANTGRKGMPYGSSPPPTGSSPL